MLHKAGQKKHGQHSSILARWLGDDRYRKSLSDSAFAESDITSCHEAFDSFLVSCGPCRAALSQSSLFLSCLGAHHTSKMRGHSIRQSAVDQAQNEAVCKQTATTLSSCVSFRSFSARTFRCFFCSSLFALFLLRSLFVADRISHLTYHRIFVCSYTCCPVLLVQDSRTNFVIQTQDNTLSAKCTLEAIWDHLEGCSRFRFDEGLGLLGALCNYAVDN